MGIELLRERDKGWLTSLFRLSIVIQMLWGAKTWFFGLIENTPIPPLLRLLIFVIAILYQSKNKIRIVFNAPFVLSIIFLFFAIITYAEEKSLRKLISFALDFYPFVVLLNDRKCYSIATFVGKTLGVLLIPSIIIHLYLFWGQLPFFFYQHPSQESYLYYNYLFTLRGAIYGYQSIRFFSFFLEPGFAGSFFALLLYVLRYDVKKWYNVVILFGLLLTLSLAAYIILFLGYLIYLLINNKPLKQLFLGGLLICFVYYWGITYNNGSNILNDNIISRLEYDNDRLIKGNNRSEGATDFYYDKLMSNGDIWFGLGNEWVEKNNTATNKDETNIEGSGYRRFSITHGLICCLLFCLFYLFFGFSLRRKTRDAMGMFMLLFVLFFSLPMVISTSWIGVYVMSINRRNDYKLINKNE